MPFARTWSEELIAEWLTLKGYMVVVGLPAGTGTGMKRGGRKEADIVGARIVEGRLEIQHIEVGTLWEGLAKNTETVKNKFSHDREQEVTKYCQRIFPSLTVDYRRSYIATGVPAKQISQLQQELGDISLQTLFYFLKTEVLPELRQRYINVKLTPPDGLWLLHLLHFMLDWEVIPKDKT
jgi:hypothetical protein